MSKTPNPMDGGLDAFMAKALSTDNTPLPEGIEQRSKLSKAALHALQEITSLVESLEDTVGKSDDNKEVRRLRREVIEGMKAQNDLQIMFAHGQISEEHFKTEKDTIDAYVNERRAKLGEAWAPIPIDRKPIERVNPTLFFFVLRAYSDSVGITSHMSDPDAVKAAVSDAFSDPTSGVYSFGYSELDVTMTNGSQAAWILYKDPKRSGELSPDDIICTLFGPKIAIAREILDQAMNAGGDELVKRGGIQGPAEGLGARVYRG